MIVDGNGNIIEERRKANRRKEEKPKLSKENSIFYSIQLIIVMGDNMNKKQSIDCSVHDCKYCDCSCDKCKLNCIKVCNCGHDETKENKVKILIFHLNLRACYKNNDFLEMERR